VKGLVCEKRALDWPGHPRQLQFVPKCNAMTTKAGCRDYRACCLVRPRMTSRLLTNLTEVCVIQLTHNACQPSV
jgi:hypothetical protein